MGLSTNRSSRNTPGGRARAVSKSVSLASTCEVGSRDISRTEK
jgi:hypothetical protein